MKLILTVAVGLALSGCAASSNSLYAQQKADAYAADIDKALNGKTAGKPQSCINLRDASGTQQVGDRTIIYKVSRKLVYRNDLRTTCPSLGRDYALVTQIYGSQLCSGDLVRPTDLVSGFNGGACSLGDFVPYRAN